MQDIIFSLLQRISSLPEIAYASADWGQLYRPSSGPAP